MVVINEEKGILINLDDSVKIIIKHQPDDAKYNIVCDNVGCTDGLIIASYDFQDYTENLLSQIVEAKSKGFNIFKIPQYPFKPEYY